MEKETKETLKKMHKVLVSDGHYFGQRLRELSYRVLVGNIIMGAGFLLVVVLLILLLVLG